MKEARSLFEKIEIDSISNDDAVIRESIKAAEEVNRRSDSDYQRSHIHYLLTSTILFVCVYYRLGLSSSMRLTKSPTRRSAPRVEVLLTMVFNRTCCRSSRGVSWRRRRGKSTPNIYYSYVVVPSPRVSPLISSQSCREGCQSA